MTLCKRYRNPETDTKCRKEELEQCSLRPREELYAVEEVQRVEDATKKRRLSYFSELYRMDESRLTKSVFSFFLQNKK